jgi:hypothetical protein
MDTEPEEPIVILANESRVLQSGLHSARIGTSYMKVLSESVEEWTTREDSTNDVYLAT